MGDRVNRMVRRGLSLDAIEEVLRGEIAALDRENTRLRREIRSTLVAAGFSPEAAAALVGRFRRVRESSSRHNRAHDGTWPALTNGAGEG